MPSAILVTGANGFVGAAVVAALLARGHSVRAVVRRQSAADDMGRLPPLDNERLEVIVVPDYTVSGSLDTAAAGCSAIIHLASPLFYLPGDLVPDAVAGTKAVLQAAEANPSIQRVIHTQSYMSIVGFKDQLPSCDANKAALRGDMNSVPILTADRVAQTEAPFREDDCPVLRYTASKVASRNTVLDYAASHEDRHFSIINILPEVIIGPDMRAETKADFFKTTNGQLSFLMMKNPANPYYGLPPEAPAPVQGFGVRLEDCVEAHVNALDEDKVLRKLENFLLCSQPPYGVVWNDAISIVRHHLPEVAAKLDFPSKQDTIPCNFLASDTEDVLLGHPMRSYAQMVKDTMSWWSCLT